MANSIYHPTMLNYYNTLNTADGMRSNLGQLGNMPWSDRPAQELYIGQDLKAPSTFGGYGSGLNFGSGVAGAGGVGNDWMTKYFGSAEGAKVGLGAIGGLASLYMGMKNYGLGRDQLAMNKDQLDFSKAAWNKNFAAQRGITNERLSSMFAARDAARGTNTAVDQMSKYGVA